MQPREGAFVQEFAKLNRDEDQQLAVCVADAVLGAAGNDYMVAGLELRDGFVDGGLAIAGDDHPVLRAMAVELQRQPVPRLRLDALGDEAGRGVYDAPRPSSDERRVGREWGSTCRSRGWQD